MEASAHGARKEGEEGESEWVKVPSKSAKGGNGGTVYYYHNRSLGLNQWYPPPPRKSAVAKHYDAVALEELTDRAAARDQGAAAPLRAYNNWVKGCMAVAAERGAASFLKPLDGLRVLDLAGGKGGDLQKWGHGPLHLGAYTLLDVSAANVKAASVRAAAQQGRARGRKRERGGGRRAPPPFTFQGLNMDIAALPPKWAMPHKAHVACLHFAANYMCDSMERLRTVLRAAAANVVRNGYLLVTFANWDEIEHRLGQSGGARVGNSVYQVDMMGGGARSSYMFTLHPSVRGCQEYGLRASELEAVAASAGWLVLDMCADITLVPPAWDALTRRARPPLPKEAREACALYGCATFTRQ